MGEKIDVAISFLSRDETLARKLHEELSSTLSVFVHPKKQEEVAGTDGMESLKAVFLTDSRLVVILYRDGWGAKGWTGVEAQAIQARALNGGWTSILLVLLEDQSTLPKWWPPTQLSLYYSKYAADLAGAIRVRAQELGSEIRVESARDRARAVAVRQQQAAHRAEILSQQGGSALRSEYASLVRALEAEILVINSQTGLGIEIGANDRQAVLRVGKVSLSLMPEGFDPHSLTCRGFHGRLMLPGQQGSFWPGYEPQRRSEQKYVLDYQPGLEWCWCLRGKHLRTVELSEDIMKRLLDLHESLSSVELPRRGAAPSGSWMS